MGLRVCGLAIFAGCLMASGCDQKSSVNPTQEAVTAEDVRRDADQAVDTMAEFSSQTKEEFQGRLDARLKELDAEIAKLRLKGQDLKDQAKVSWDQKIAELETKREAALSKMAEVGRSSAEAWKDLQNGAQSAWAELDKAIQEASREF